MILTFIGSGSAFTIGDDNYQSNMLIKSPEGKRLLLDCGGDIRFGLHEMNLTATDIDALFISHLHADHTGGLEWLAFNNYFSRPRKKPTLYISEHLESDLWNKVLSGGLSSLKGKNASLSTYFVVKKIGPKNKFTWSKVTFHLIKTLHSESGKKVNPSYGLMFGDTFITTDTQFTPDLFKVPYEKSSLIFHDCETSGHPTGVHAHYNQLKTLPDSIKKKMWLYHYNPGKLPDACALGFCGFVKKGQCFTLP